MHSPISRAIAILGVATPVVHAINSFKFPSVVTAGKPTTLTVNNAGADSSDDTFRVSLIITPPKQSETSPACWLVNSTTSIDTATLSITIPADIGPSGSYYALAVRALTADGESDSILTEGGFDLEGGTEQWSPAELAGVPFAYGFGEDTVIPCTSYNCVRNCTLGVPLTTNVKDLTNQEVENETKTLYECVAACPGINIPPWNETYGAEVFGDSSSLPASSPASASASSGPTTLATASAETTPAITSSPAKSTSTSAPTSTSASAPTSGTSNSTVPTQHSSSATQFAVGIPILLAFAAGMLLM